MGGAYQVHHLLVDILEARHVDASLRGSARGVAGEDENEHKRGLLADPLSLPRVNPLALTGKLSPWCPFSGDGTPEVETVEGGTSPGAEHPSRARSC